VLKAFFRFLLGCCGFPVNLWSWGFGFAAVQGDASGPRQKKMK
jgi:hypothetical protein